ncbi:hypothetical protein [Flavobacterium chungangense]|uniref:Dihydrolipoamide dehydrogenase n=1 Tax=Flavobacterium chungangense TaxID=554283 RepID=A0A6V6ZBC7_9FLAO|nr:hypothetical protein [Flavobacterium chungangense]CAD0009081.1 hypothetical protein FLACHUCJ7_04080 [Flavobacterium chungangense]
MKKIFLLFAVVGLTVFSSCEGPEGPPGLPGPAADVFEVEKVNFNATASSDFYFNFKTRIYPGDVVLVYRYAGFSPTTNLDVWAILPDSHYYTDGGFHFGYKFDFTQDNVRIYTEGLDLVANPIPADFRTNQIFRIVVIPGNNPIVTTAKSVNKADYSNYYEVIKKYNIDDSNVQKLN